MSLGLHGPGMHQFVLDELELGLRVACALDAEAVWGGMSWFYDLLYALEAAGL